MPCRRKCVPPCAENKIGLIFYRFMVTNILTLKWSRHSHGHLYSGSWAWLCHMILLR